MWSATSSVGTLTPECGAQSGGAEDRAAASVLSITGTTLYAKILVQAVDPVSRQIKVRYTVDPNCGFFSFATGLPKN